MKAEPAIADLRARHEKLYASVLKDSAAVLDGGETLEAYVRDANELIDDMESAAPSLRGEDDRAWLRGAADVWRIVLPTYLRTRREIKISLPADDPLSPGRVLPEDEVARWINEQAYEIYKHRKVGEHLRAVERLLAQKREHDYGQGQEDDRRAAEVEFAMRVVEGVVNFAAQLKSDSFKHLEAVWLRDVKKLRAYYFSLADEDDAQSHDTLAYYYKACERLRDLLASRDIKAAPKEFDEARAYLSNAYLDGGRVDAEAKAHALIETKAAKLAQLRASDPVKDAAWDVRNWRQAEDYVKMFYENIIPAAETGDEERTLLVLKAFQYSGEFGTHYRIINCFEVALAVYFLDPEVVRKFWDASDGRPVPASWSFNEVSVESWPEEFDARDVCGDSFAYDAAYGRVSFSGVMLSEQFEALDGMLRTPEHKAHLKTLFEQSRLLPRHTTL